jgi:hypothetical protein
MVARAAPVIAAPGPIEDVHAKVCMRFFIFVNPHAICTRIVRCDEDVREVRILLQSLTDTCDIAMTKNAKHACKELDLLSVPADVLVLQEFDDGCAVVNRMLPNFSFK